MAVLLQIGRRISRFVPPGKLRLVNYLLLAAFWFQTSGQILAGHADSALCGHAACDVECACVCHDVFASAASTAIYLEQPKMAGAPALDETTRDLLIPNEIFRPPPVRS